MMWKTATRAEAEEGFRLWKERHHKWHRWFAWKPIPEGHADYPWLTEYAQTKPTGRWIWLQWVERRFMCEGGEFGGYYHYEYRLPLHDDINRDSTR